MDPNLVKAGVDDVVAGTDAVIAGYEAGPSTVTLIPDGFVSALNVRNEVSATTGLHTSVDEAWDDPNVGDTYVLNNPNASGEMVLTLSDLPVDYASMSSIAVRIRIRKG